MRTRVSKKGTSESGYFAAIGWFSVKTFADRHRHAAYLNKYWQ